MFKKVFKLVLNGERRQLGQRRGCLMDMLVCCLYEDFGWEVDASPTFAVAR